MRKRLSLTFGYHTGLTLTPVETSHVHKASGRCDASKKSDRMHNLEASMN